MLANREEINEVLDDQVESVRNSQTKHIYNQGDSFSKEQGTILDFIAYYIKPSFEDDLCSSCEHETVGEWANDLHDRLRDIKLDNTDEDRILREIFRSHPEYRSFPDWPTTEFLEALETFLEENIEESTEYQAKIAGESAVNAQLVCCGII